MYVCVVVCAYQVFVGTCSPEVKHTNLAEALTIFYQYQLVVLNLCFITSLSANLSKTQN